jgi:phosphoglycolate phosphatase-like HAD superfamily hydrolase
VTAYDAVVFDSDGVLVELAADHEDLDALVDHLTGT